MTDIRKKAMDLLARREHSAQELHQKLIARGYAAEDVNQVIEILQSDRLQSDERFTESYVHHRYQAGVGPVKIRFELLSKGVEGGLIDQHVEEFDVDWDRLMTDLRVRKYGEAIPEDYAERMKQARFLQNRGFSPESVMRLFR